jgi:hypothetical protein
MVEANFELNQRRFSPVMLPLPRNLIAHSGLPRMRSKRLRS